MKAEHRSPVDVFALLLREGQVLLTRRAGGIPGAGQWALPSGRLEAGEHVVTAVCRELAEELGLLVVAQDTTHANDIVERIKQDDFFDGQYKDKVITKMTGGLAGMAKGLQEGWLDLKGKRVVAVLTGHGLKDPDTAIKGMPTPKMIPATIGALLEIIA